MSSIFTGVSGIQANQKAVDVIANNVANLNTTSFKASRVSFAEALSNTMSSGGQSGINPMQVGMGVSVGSIDRDMNQGNLRQTGRQLDLAMVGDGYFLVSDGVSQRYTRNGVFQLDAQNRLVMAGNGMKVYGWQADQYTGQLSSTANPPTELTVPIGTLYAVPTTNAVFGGNLNAAATIGDTVSTTMSVYDSLGTPHSLGVTFTKSGANTWNWTATSADAAVGTSPGSGTLTFDVHGQLTTSTGSVNLQLASANGASNPVHFNIDFTSTSQLDGDNSIQPTSQDGLPMGVLQNFSIDVDGTITGTFSSGATRVVGQLAVVRFANPTGLADDGNSLWNVAPNSGNPLVQTAGTSNNVIRSGYLESSNVDLSAEFANLIVMQRGFQANSRSITTSDEMLQEVLQLKR